MTGTAPARAYPDRRQKTDSASTTSTSAAATIAPTPSPPREADGWGTSRTGFGSVFAFEGTTGRVDGIGGMPFG